MHVGWRCQWEKRPQAGTGLSSGSWGEEPRIQRREVLDVRGKLWETTDPEPWAQRENRKFKWVPEGVGFGVCLDPLKSILGLYVIREKKGVRSVRWTEWPEQGPSMPLPRSGQGNARQDMSPAASGRVCPLPVRPLPEELRPGLALDGTQQALPGGRAEDLS